MGTPILDTFNQGIISGTLTEMVIGGTASVISGGKFANGAITAAYQTLFNYFGETIVHLAKVKAITDDRDKKVKFLNSLDSRSENDRTLLAMWYCSGGYDNNCSSFDSIKNDPFIANSIKMEMFININAEANKLLIPVLSDVTESYYSDALGVPIGRGFDVLRNFSKSLDWTLKQIDKNICVEDEKGECR